MNLVVRESADAVIIGAGAAGLAAAEGLHRKKRDVIVLEARDRIGGRISTLHPESLAVPVELGAEFIHGPAEEVMQIAAIWTATRCRWGGGRELTTRCEFIRQLLWP